MRELKSVNYAVNRFIIPKDDQTIGGIADNWCLGVRRGDCEDYALLKRQRLLRMGWHLSHLRIATALTEEREGHAVLIVRLGGVDFSLDNLTNTIRPWDKTGHLFLRIQSDEDPNLWFFAFWKNED